MTDASSHGPHSSGDRSSFGFRDVDAREKVKMVRGVFDSVASNYDVMNDLMSVGVHRVWKDIAAAKLNPRPGETILDVAGGTGDMARRYSKMARAAQERRGGTDASVIVLDYNAEMILAGVAKGGEPEMSWSVGDAMNLPLPDASVDAYSISFGIRNVAHIDKALAEARRVLKPSGRLLFCEHGLAPDPGVARWQRRVEPVWKRLAGGCHLTRPVAGTIRGAGLAIARLESMYLPKAPRMLGWNEWGEARPG